MGSALVIYFAKQIDDSESDIESVLFNTNSKSRKLATFIFEQRYF